MPESCAFARFFALRDRLIGWKLSWGITMERIAVCACGQLTVCCRGEPTTVSLCHCLACQSERAALTGSARFSSAPRARIGLHHLRRRRGHSRSCRSLRPFMTTWRSKRLSSALGASREAALLSCRIHSRSRIAHRSYWRRPETRTDGLYANCVCHRRRFALLRSRPR
jgi:hypothetical protein